MYEGIVDSIIASILGKLFKYILKFDILCKIRFFINNPPIYSRFICLKKYPEFEFDFIEIKKYLFNNENNESYPILKKINYEDHGKNYFKFNIKESGATYIMEITNEIKGIDVTFNENQNLILRIKSTSPIISNYRNCNEIIDLNVISAIYKNFEKKYDLIETFCSYELISSCNKKVTYPKGNVIKENDGINQIIYNSTSLSIKSNMINGLIECLNKNKLKLFKNQGDLNEYSK